MNKRNGNGKFTYVVSKNGNGDFTSVQQAIDSIPSYSNQREYILIKDGTYKERLKVPSDKDKVTLVGQNKKKVILTYDAAANKVNPKTGKKYGTDKSASTFVNGSGFAAVNITFQNSAGYYDGRKGKTNHGQTLAINITGDKSVFENCRFLSGQDTFYAGEVRSYVKNSYIQGTTDFIFGPAKVVFKNCNIHSYGGTAVTAANTKSYVDYGLVFWNCTVSGESGVQTTLGRPWRGYAAVAFLKSKLGKAIKPKGWTNWHQTDRYKTARYVEYDNSGPGYTPSKRVSWDHILTDSSKANKYKTLNVMKTTYSKNPKVDNWNPKMVLKKINKHIGPQ